MSDVEMNLAREFESCTYGDNLSRLYGLEEPCNNISKNPNRYRQELIIWGYINNLANNIYHHHRNMVAIIIKYIYSQNIFICFPFDISSYGGDQLIRISSDGKSVTKISDANRFALTPVQMYSIIDSSIAMYKFKIYCQNSNIFGFSLYNVKSPSLAVIAHIEELTEEYSKYLGKESKFTVILTINTTTNVSSNPQIRIEFESNRSQKPLGTLYKDIPFSNGEEYFICLCLTNLNQKYTLKQFQYQPKEYYN